MEDVDLCYDQGNDRLVETWGPMMPKFIDRTGLRYGRLTVLRLAGRTTSKKTLWECYCDCGTVTRVDSCKLVTGNTESCGCLLKERITKHGGTGKGSYNTWRAMVRRCTNPEDKDYWKYGGMGISVDPRWLDYLTFAADMGEPPTPNHTLDRVNPEGNYEPANCRWATVLEQNRNIRSFGRLRGVSLRGSRWYAIIGLNNRQIYSKSFATAEEAAEERKRMELLYWGDKNEQ